MLDKKNSEESKDPYPLESEVNLFFELEEFKDTLVDMHKNIKKERELLERYEDDFEGMIAWISEILEQAKTIKHEVCKKRTPEHLEYLANL